MGPLSSYQKNDISPSISNSPTAMSPRMNSSENISEGRMTARGRHCWGVWTILESIVLSANYSSIILAANRSGKNLFWSIKNLGEILDKLKARNFNATSLSTYDFSTLYTTLPYNLIKDKLVDFIERTFQREGSPYVACNDRNASFYFGKT